MKRGKWYGNGSCAQVGDVKIIAAGEGNYAKNQRPPEGYTDAELEQFSQGKAVGEVRPIRRNYHNWGEGNVPAYMVPDKD